MRAVATAGCFIIILFQFVSASAVDPKQQAPVSPKFVVYASEEDSGFGSSLFRVLNSRDQVTRIETARTIEKAVASQADVLILAMPNRGLPTLEIATLEALENRKIIGIGHGAALLFGRLGLEINGGECMHFKGVPSTLSTGKSDLLKAPSNAKPIQVLREEFKLETDPEVVQTFGIFLPPNGKNASVVDAIARWTIDANYAPIVRQGNFVLIGIPIPASRWTVPYADLIREICQALHDRKPEAFSKPRREETKSGTYEFKLASYRSTEAGFDKTFFFRFTDTTRFSAKLEHAGSDAVMLVFVGEGDDLAHLWIRKDARLGETLSLTNEITPEDIEKLGDRYWSLNVTNFGANMPVDCKLTIAIEKP